MNTKRRENCQLRNDWKERIIRIGDEQTSLQNQFDNLRNEFTDNSPRIEALEADVNALDGRLIIAESDIADAEDRISACEADIDRIDAELTDKTGEINALANRVTLAEADIDNIDARLEGIEAGEILLSQLVPDTDKDMAGKALNNVKINANEIKIGGANIDRTRQNEILLYDMQTEIESGTLNIISPNYTIVTESDLTAPYSKVVETNTKFGSVTSPWGDYIPVMPGEKIHIEAWIKPLQIVDGSYGYFLLLVGRYDKDKKPIGEYSGRGGLFFNYRTMELNKWRKITYTMTLPTSHTPYNGSDGGPVRYIRIMYGANVIPTQPNDTIRICGIKYYREAKFTTDIQAKVATFDGVIIQDGGTVDGVDISAHTHDGTAIGGPKISYNDLVDKPTIPTMLSQLATDENNQRVSISKIAEWDGKADGSIFTAAKATEWDGKARPPAFKQYFNDNLTTPTTEYLELSAGRQAFIPMRIAANKQVGTGNISIYAIFDDSSELLLLSISGSSTNAFRRADEIAEILGNGNKSGRTITRFKIVQEEEGTGTARIDAFEY